MLRAEGDQLMQALHLLRKADERALSQGIVIANPSRSSESVFATSADFSSPGTDSIRLLTDTLKDSGINPKSHPTVAILGAGLAPEASVFIAQGWQAHAIHCFDKLFPDLGKHPGRAYEMGLAWHYWDLRVLLAHVRLKHPLPPEVEAHQNKYDIVTIFYSLFDIDSQVGVPGMERLLRFFMKPEGLALDEYTVYYLDGKRNPKVTSRIRSYHQVLPSRTRFLR